MKTIRILIIFCCFLVPRSAFCDELTMEKKAAINELLEITGALKIGEIFGNAVSTKMIELLRATNADINPKAFEIVKEEVAVIIHEELVVKNSFQPYMYPIYHKYLTLEEIQGLIKFYKTPIGKKTISVMPKMTQEGMMAGQAWGQSIAPKIQQRIEVRLRQENIKID